MATALSSLLSTGLSSTGSGTSSSGSTTFAGLGQGINVTSFVQLAEANAQANITNFQAQQTAVNSQSSTLATITANLTALQSAVQALNDPLGVLAAQTATSSNTNDLTAAATSSAVAGTHSIAITSLATTSSYYTDAVAAGTTPLATGDALTISAGGTQVASVTVNSNNHQHAFGHRGGDQLAINRRASECH